DVRHLDQQPGGLARSASRTVTRSVATSKKLTEGHGGVQRRTEGAAVLWLSALPGGDPTKRLARAKPGHSV
ncbi:hypothetical protein ABZV81_35605, partial [Streptomyces parvus]|uniref:hypothetical protein n=1 Tax=Streptomyces parvus TaxID=66428 RepID=UPI00339DBA66